MYKKIGYGLSLSIHLLVIAFILLPNFQRKHIPQERPISVSIIAPRKKLNKKPSSKKTPHKKQVIKHKKPPQKAISKKKVIPKKVARRSKPTPQKKSPTPKPKKISKPQKKIIKPLPQKAVVQKKPAQSSQKEKVDDDFMKVLKSLEKVEAQALPSQQSTTQETPQHIEDILSEDELSRLKEQLKGCWHVPAGARHAQDLAVELKVKLAQDAKVLSIETLNPKTNNEFYIVAEESARRALMNPDCTPLEMPKGKFDIWQESIFTFDPKEIL